MDEEHLRAEHELLKRQTEALQREHDALSRAADPDGSLHAEHRLHLEHKIAELRAHMSRLLERKRLEGAQDTDLSPD